VRIVFLNQYYAPDEVATAELVTDLAQELVRHGHDVSVVCSDRCYGDPDRRFSRREQLNGVKVHRVRSSGFGRRRATSRILDSLSYLTGAGLSVLFGGPVDMVVSLSTPPMVSTLGLLLARTKRARAAYWVMDLYPDVAFALNAVSSKSVLGRALSRLSAWTLRRSDIVIALGETMAHRLRERGAQAVAVAHNWVDGDRIRPRPVEQHPLRAAYGWEGRWVVLYSGTLGLAHDFETVLDAAEKLSGEDEILFVFVGSGSRTRELECQVRERVLGNVELLPQLAKERLDEGLTSADLHLVTLRPGLSGLLVPSKIYGVLAAGRPTVYVGPEDGEVADILRQAGCGVRIAPGDADGLTRAVLGYRGDPARWGRAAKQARAVFERRFDRRLALDRLVRILEREGGERE
jgi:glycosyltransferase involved in cell wall biosynthesis